MASITRAGRIRPTGLRPNHLGRAGRRLIRRDRLHVFRRLPPRQLDDPVGQRLLADHDPHRNADQVGVLELEARPFVAVVEQDVDAVGRQGVVA